MITPREGFIQNHRGFSRPGYANYGGGINAYDHDPYGTPASIPGYGETVTTNPWAGLSTPPQGIGFSYGSYDPNGGAHPTAGSPGSARGVPAPVGLPVRQGFGNGLLRWQDVINNWRAGNPGVRPPWMGGPGMGGPVYGGGPVTRPPVPTPPVRPVPRPLPFQPTPRTEPIITDRNPFGVRPAVARPAGGFGFMGR